MYSYVTDNNNNNILFALHYKLQVTVTLFNFLFHFVAVVLKKIKLKKNSYVTGMCSHFTRMYSYVLVTIIFHGLRRNRKSQANVSSMLDLL